MPCHSHLCYAHQRLNQQLLLQNPTLNYDQHNFIFNTCKFKYSFINKTTDWSVNLFC